ncbi:MULTISPECIES: succinate dehydrogenase flavoprotein subunit [Brevibacillus]|jgi:succinate dehydrogenase / fumarate reductase flavoprotein subunit|uniref:succinate dehydrogenase n=1 Tax=Brevibacillus borstelensis AK1 TaxID=1300222 RepID=M8E0T6_9BACL|nr:succinate dehydrogenase flavoprotein subunit [Brevibacillus borstelensis]EMT52906.1 succinate dehydrogenase flavoprotein subunit [Brevibacillus borstelensis AK1]KKX55679.1 succinate dehydrogenase [Brevibacillus borstelensis cifa_chp40]MBE5397120.1 succinate dehydrogenase flavoprotein subunit [Brevibacillus borstelensis]MCM3591161.1 succinate dehydrogenase flavoprotein subunit [Brevibacillus borstelensis]MCM3624794.1 succinate dehydrogenase flavoprotein subunit [Brevibacillus borstelensis]
MAKGKLIIVGGGLAGLMATIKAAEKGVPVELFSLVPVKRSHSVCAQGGINGAVNTKGEGDSTWEHFDDTVYGGDFLANQPPVKAMCDAAPGIIYMLDRMGVMFNRTPEGLLDFRRFGGTKHHRTAFAGATTGQQLLYALDEQVRRFEAEGLVTKYEYWDFLGVVLDEKGTCKGITAQNLRSAEIRSFRADAVIMATGGPGIIFGKSTNSIINTGTAASAAYQQGVIYANGEMIQIHPTAIPGDDKLRLMSESARGEGGRVWTYKDGKPWYFLEEKYPAYGNLVPRDIATREIFHVCVDMKLGINGENMVYLDLSHKDPKELDVKLGGIIEIYEKFVGDDPRKVPMKIFPAVHYSMGGMWVDYNQMTNIPGLFAAGECDYSQHGANRLGANSLLSAIFGGMVAGPKAIEYINGLDESADDLSSAIFDSYTKQNQEKYDNILKMDGTENAYLLHKELGEWMTDNVTVVRYNDRLQKTDEKIQELMERYKKININDTSKWSNSGASFTRHLWNMLVLARVITLGALNRNESRGAHYKPEFPERDDENFMKTTMAKYNPETTAPEIYYEDVDVSLIPPRKRDYTSDKKKK